jgi:ABC-type multidrug transport system fused ATPase/permease subunit
MPFQFIKVDHLPESDVVQLPNKLLPFIWYFVRQAKWQYAAISGSYIVSTTLMGLTSYFIKLFIDALEATADRSQMWDNIFWIVMGYVGLCVILQSVIWRLANYVSVKTQSRFTNMVRRQMSLYMSHHSYAYFQNDFAGRLSGKVTETPSSLRRMMQNITETFVYSIMTFIVSFILLAMTGWEQLVIMSVIAIIYAWLLIIYLPELKILSKLAADQRSITRGRHVDAMTNILNIKIFARGAYEDRYFLKALKGQAIRFERKDARLFDFTRKLDILMKSIWIFPALYVLYAWQHHGISTGDVAMVLSLSITLGFNMWGFTFTLSTFFEELGEVQEGMETITQAHTVTDKENAPKLHVNSGDIEIKNMSFSYGSKPVKGTE